MTDEQFIRLASEGLCQVIDALAPARFAPAADRMAMKEALAAACEVELPEVTAANVGADAREHRRDLESGKAIHACPVNTYKS